MAKFDHFGVFVSVFFFILLLGIIQEQHLKIFMIYPKLSISFTKVLHKLQKEKITRRTTGSKGLYFLQCPKGSCP
jgi:hypothetical protein